MIVTETFPFVRVTVPFWMRFHANGWETVCLHHFLTSFWLVLLRRPEKSFQSASSNHFHSVQVDVFYHHFLDIIKKRSFHLGPLFLACLKLAVSWDAFSARWDVTSVQQLVQIDLVLVENESSFFIDVFKILSSLCTMNPRSNSFVSCVHVEVSFNWNPFVVLSVRSVSEFILLQHSQCIVELFGRLKVLALSREVPIYSQQIAKHTMSYYFPDAVKIGNAFQFSE